MREREHMRRHMTSARTMRIMGARVLGLTGAVALVASAFTAQPVSAGETLVVDDDGVDCPHATHHSIQEAVTVAQTGDTVFVCAGTYRERVTISTPAKNDVRVIGKDPDAVVLEGNGTLPTGFFLEGVSGALIERFTVRGFGENISLLNAHGNTVRHNVVAGAAGDGIVLRGSHRNLVGHNVSFGNGPADRGTKAGIAVLTGSTENVLRHNATYQNLLGIHLRDGGTGNVVEHNDSSDNRLGGIVNHTTPRTRIAHNRSNHNGNNGIVAVVVHGSSVSHQVAVKHNDASDNGGSGIAVLHGSDNVVRHNHVRRNGSYGIVLHETFRNAIERNHVSDNAEDGIGVTDHGIPPFSAENLIKRNTMTGNGEHDCHDDSRGGGTAGTANYWVRNKGATQTPDGICSTGGS